MPKKLRRSVVALATTLACLTLMATPASATTHAITITGGTLLLTPVVGTLATLNIMFGGTGGTGCGSTFAADVASGAVDLTTFSHLHHFTLGSNHYVATITRTASTAGTWGTGTTGTISSATLTISVVLRAAANNSSTNVDCATTGTVLCTVRATLHLAGTYTNGPLSTAGASISLSTTTPAFTTLVPGTCQVPWTTFNGGTATVTGLTGVM